MVSRIVNLLSSTRARRALFTILGATLVAALAALATIRSWAMALLALSVITAIVAVTVLDVRTSRIMLYDVRWRLGKTDRRVDELRTHQQHAGQHLAGRVAQLEQDLSRARSLLALCLYEQSKTSPEPVTRLPLELVPVATGGLLDRGDALDANALVSATKSIASLPVGTLRRLCNELQRRGYLVKALEAARTVERASGDEQDRLKRQRIQADVAVLSGRFRPTIRADVGSYKGRPGRVLHLVGRSLPQDQVGYTIRTHYTAIAQKESGLDPHIVTQMGYANPGEEHHAEEIDGVTYHRIPGPSRSNERPDHWLRAHVQRVANLVRVNRPAILQPSSDFINALTARVIGTAYGIPVVYESRGFWEETWLSRKAQECDWDINRLEREYGLPDEYLWRRDIENQMRTEADRVVTLAQVMADRIEAGGVRRDRIVVVPNGVAVDNFPVLSRNQELAASLGISEDTTVIGYISSLVEYEGIDTLIDAYSTIKQSSSKPVALLIVGDGPVRNRLTRQAEALGLDDVRFTGRVPHDAVLDYYSLIDLFVVPRRPVEVCHLVTPLKPFEAFATGRAVVLSDVRALASIADESRAAETFEAGSAKSLADTLLALLDDPGRRKELADAGAAWVRTERTWSANALTYLDLYRELGAIDQDHQDPRMLTIDELRASLPAAKLLPVEAGLPSAQQRQVAAPEPRFSAHPFVCGAIGRWDPVAVERMRLAGPAGLRKLHESDTAIVWASSDLHRWQSGAQHGLYWAPMAAGSTPVSWRTAAEGRLAAGLAFENGTALLHTCALGLQELYVRELNGGMYFAVRVDPLLAVDSSPLHPDPVAWASILAIGCPIGDATPFSEIRRAVAATAWRTSPDSSRRITTATFEPAWLGVEPSASATPAELVEVVAAQIPDRFSRMSIPLSGGRDSRLLASLAHAKAASSLTAWTTSTDDGLERDLALAAPVAEALQLDHRLVVPGPEAWLQYRDEVRARLQYQTWYHTWIMPLARSLHKRGDIVLDGLGGDALLDGGVFINQAVRNQAAAYDQRAGLLAKLSNGRLNDTGLLAPVALSWAEQSVQAAFLTATDHLGGHREMLLLSLLGTRTARAIASSPICLIAPEADVRVPFVHPDVITAALRVPVERRVSGALYQELLVAACGLPVGSLPTTKDRVRSGRRVARRQAGAPALAAVADAITQDEIVSRLLDVDLLRALKDASGRARIATSYNGRVTLQWAEMLSHWRRRYSGRLASSSSFLDD